MALPSLPCLYRLLLVLWPRNPAAGFLLCRRAAALGSQDALVELGHCFLDGLGVDQNRTHGHRILARAKALEAEAARAAGSIVAGEWGLEHGQHRHQGQEEQHAQQREQRQQEEVRGGVVIGAGESGRRAASATCWAPRGKGYTGGSIHSHGCLCPFTPTRLPLERKGPLQGPESPGRARAAAHTLRPLVPSAPCRAPPRRASSAPPRCCVPASQPSQHALSASSSPQHLQDVLSASSAAQRSEDATASSYAAPRGSRDGGVEDMEAFHQPFAGAPLAEASANGAPDFCQGAAHERKDLSGILQLVPGGRQVGEQGLEQGEGHQQEQEQQWEQGQLLQGEPGQGARLWGEEEAEESEGDWQPYGMPEQGQLREGGAQGLLTSDELLMKGGEEGEEEEEREWEEGSAADEGRLLLCRHAPEQRCLCRHRRCRGRLPPGAQNVPGTAPASATHQFLADWWSVHLEREMERQQQEAAAAMGQPRGVSGGLPSSVGGGQSLCQELEQQSLCSHELCGRRESRAKEFRCCASCREAKYCSRACQARDWRRGHKLVCTMLTMLQHQHFLHTLQLEHQEQQHQQQEHQEQELQQEQQQQPLALQDLLGQPSGVP